MNESKSLQNQLPSRWRPLFSVLADMDRGIAEVYAGLGIQGVRPRFSMALMFLDADGPMTIRRLAQECGVTHSAMSQSVAQMLRAGLVESTVGQDARSRIVSLASRGREAVPSLKGEWYATEAAIAELEDELPYPPSRMADDLAQAMARRPFAARVLGHLEAVPPVAQG